MTSPKASPLYQVLYSFQLRNNTFHVSIWQVPFTFDKRFKNPCWYDGFKLKCLPYFFVIGVKKGGTTELMGTIMKHPEVISPGFKEAQFFARGRFSTYFVCLFPIIVPDRKREPWCIYEKWLVKRPHAQCHHSSLTAVCYSFPTYNKICNRLLLTHLGKDMETYVYKIMVIE